MIGDARHEKRYAAQCGTRAVVSTARTQSHASLNARPHGVDQVAHAEKVAAQRSRAKAQIASMRKVRAEAFEQESRRIKQEAALELTKVQERLRSTSHSNDIERTVGAAALAGV